MALDIHPLDATQSGVTPRFLRNLNDLLFLFLFDIIINVCVPSYRHSSTLMRSDSLVHTHMTVVHKSLEEQWKERGE